MPFAQIRRGNVWVPLSTSGVSTLFVIGAVEPTALNTGPSGLWAVDKKAVNLLTPLYGDQVFSTPGATYRNLDIFGFVTLSASNITLSGCKVRGYVSGILPGGAKSSPPAASTGLINTNNAGVTNAIVQDCELIPDNPNQAVDAIFARRYTSLRNHIERCVDGLGSFDTSSANSAQVKAYGNFIDKHAWFYPAAGHSDGSHCDGCQHQGGNQLDYRGNRNTGLIDPTLPGFSSTDYFRERGHYSSLYLANSAMQLNENTGQITTGVVISNNWFGGGDIATLNWAVVSHIDAFDNNIFDGNNGLGKSWAVSTYTGTTFGHAPVGNKFRDGTPVVIRYSAAP